MMLSEGEAQRLRAEVHAAMVARQYDVARAKLQELAQHSRPPPSTRLRQCRKVGTVLLRALIAAGGGLVGVGGLEGHPILFTIGVWLVTLGLIVWLLLSRDPSG